MSSTSASFSLQVEKTTLPTILKVFFLVGRIKHYRVCLPLFRHRRNTTILLLSITKPQKSRQRKRNNFAKLADNGKKAAYLHPNQIKNLPIRSIIVKIYGLYISCSVCRKVWQSVQPATIVQKGKSKEHS